MEENNMSNNSDTITISKNDLWKYSTFVLLAVVLIGGAVFFLGGNGTGNVVANNPQQAAAPQPSQVTVSADDDAVLGDPNAPVEIIEFSDYQCPFCRKFWSETFHQLREEYIDTGKVKFVYRDFPLDSIHPAARVAAEAANCVREQGGDEAYYEMHDKIYMESNLLDGGDAMTGPVRGTVQFSATDLQAWAQELGYDIGECLSSGKYQSEIQKDLNDGQAAGARGTPYFVVNGMPLSGAQPYSAFKQVIEAELA